MYRTRFSALIAGGLVLPASLVLLSGNAAAVAVYTNSTSYTGVATSNGAVIANGSDFVTPMLFDDIMLLPGAGGQGLTSVSFGVANNNTTGGSPTVSAYVRFYKDDGVDGGPGTRIGGLAAVTTGVAAKTYQRFTLSPTVGQIPLPLNGKIWVGVAFGTGNGATVTQAQLANFGLPNFNPMTVGSSTTSYFTSSAGGTYTTNNPAGTFAVGASTPKVLGSFSFDLAVAALGPVNVTTDTDTGEPGTFRYTVAQTSAAVPIAFRNTANAVNIWLINGEVPLLANPTSIQLPIGKDVTIGSGNATSFISGAGALSVTGPGQLRLNGPNTYSDGTTLLSSPPLGLGNSSALGTGTLSIVSSTKIFSTNNEVEIPNAVSISAGSALSITDSPEGPKALSFSGNITGFGSLEAKGTAQLSLKGSNGFTGGLTLTSGTLSVTGSASFGGASNPVTFNGGTLQAAGSASISLAGHPLNSTSFNSAINVADASGVLTLGVPLTGTSRIVKTGQGTLQLNGTNSPGGGIALSGGQLAFNGTAPGISTGTALTLNSGTLVIPSTGPFAMGGLQGSGDFVRSDSTSPASTTPVVLSVGNGGATSTYGGVITDEGGSYPLAFEKAGSGAQTLSASQLYSGPTQVKEGTLILSGSLPNTASLGVSSGATLTLNGGAIGSASSASPITIDGTFKGTGTFFGPLTNNGTMLVDGGALVLKGDTVNNGTIRLVNGASLDAAAAGFTNNGLLDLLGGSAILPEGFVNGPNGIVLTSDSLHVKTILRDPVAGTVTLEIDSYSNHTFRLQKSLTLAPEDFVDVAGTSQPGVTGTILTFSDPNATDDAAFYRIAID